MVDSMSYRDLQRACKAAGLVASGKTAVLRERLRNVAEAGGVRYPTDGITKEEAEIAAIEAAMIAAEEEEEAEYEHDDEELVLKALESIDDEVAEDERRGRHIRPKPTSRFCELACWALLACALVGALDTYVVGGATYDAVACVEGAAAAAPDAQTCEGIKRLGFHQGKTEAKWLYFFIAHIYDRVLNPWHWTEAMRDAALNGVAGNAYGLKAGFEVCDVGAGTGFTSIGVLGKGVAASQLTMLDQSPQQRSKAVAKAKLQDVRQYIMGDAEALPANWSNHFDRYVSAGSIEYWPHPQRALREAHRVLKVGGKAMIIGPTRATNPISRFFSDLWYLFPTDAEYLAWFTRAGFTDVKVEPIRPEWYAPDDRAHGLIMGSVVVGTKSSPSVVATAPAAEVSATVSAVAENKAYATFVTVPRFVLGSLGGVYYAAVPFAIWLKNAYCYESWIATLLALVLPTLFLLYTIVLPRTWQPYVAGPALYNGIANLYDSSSAIWLKVWGEHMHSGFYDNGVDPFEEKWVKEDHLEAQDRMMQELLNLWVNDTDFGADAGAIVALAAAAGSDAGEAEAEEEEEEEGDVTFLRTAKHSARGGPSIPTLRVLDAGCGVGGSSRFLYRTLKEIMASMDHFGSAAAEIEVVGITLSSYQQAKATELTAACDDIPAGAVTFRVANALATPFEDGNFDLVWSLESGEHMPDKHEWLAEISRLLRPGGTFLCATWCCREHAYSEFAELAEGPAASPLSQEETVLLGRICKNYSLPKFVPLSTYDAACHDNNLADFAESARSWTTHVLPFWPAVIRSSLLPLSLLRIICSLPCGGWTTLKGAITAKLMMDGFEKGTLNFGVFAVRKL